MNKWIELKMTDILETNDVVVYPSSKFGPDELSRGLRTTSGFQVIGWRGRPVADVARLVIKDSRFYRISEYGKFIPDGPRKCPMNPHYSEPLPLP